MSGAQSPWVCLSCTLTMSSSMWVMSANTGMMVGTWYYRADDKPSL